MASCENANISLLPTSEEYYAVIGTGKLAFLFLDSALVLIILLLFAEECYFVTKTYTHFDIGIKSMWVISIYPAIAMASLLSVVIPRASLICDFVATCYLSACLFQFSSLLLLYFGHADHLLRKVKDTGFNLKARPCCCCCVCCPVLPPTRQSLRTVRLLVFQTTILQPIIQFISAVLWADDKYNTAYGFDLTQSNVYLSVMKLTSTITAIYGLNALHISTRPHLLTHNTKPKHMALQLVLILYNIQATILSIPAQFSVPPCRDGLSSKFQMREWSNLVLVVEMFLLSVLARIYYRRPLAMDAILEAQSGSLADIYTPSIAHNMTEYGSTHTESMTKEAPGQQEIHLSHEDGDSSPNTASRQMQADQHNSVSKKKNATEEGVKSEDFYLVLPLEH